MLSKETIVVEKVTQWGVRANGKNYSLSPKLKGANVTPQHFAVGASYNVDVWTGPQGGKSINGYAEVGQVASQPTVLPPPPALPPTTVAATPAPGGVAPIAPARAAKAGDDDKMSKADWANKDRMIGIDAVIKSTLESPALGQLVVGKNQQEAFLTAREFIKYNLETQQMAKEGTL